jgi:hypothetical protein
MDGPRQQPERDADRLTRDVAGGSDLPIYIFALIATIALTVGLFAWVKIDPEIAPPADPVSRNEMSELPAYAMCVPINRHGSDRRPAGWG